jgi:hypothetical protein
MKRVVAAIFALAIFTGSASAQGIDCQALLNELLNSPPGVYTPGQAQDMANVYNQECLGQQTQYQQPQYQPPQQSDAELFGQIVGTMIGGMMRR